jgi:hypothetical protein
MRRSIVRSAVFIGGIALVAIAAVSVPVSRRIHQQQLNHTLIEAVKRKDPVAVHALLASGADANMGSNHPTSALFWWSLPDSQTNPASPANIEAQTVELALIEHGANVNAHFADVSALSNAVVFENVAEVKALLARGTTLSGRENAEFTRSEAMAAYHREFKTHPRSAQIWRLLVQHGVVPAL